jgi:hypothetical protein
LRRDPICLRWRRESMRLPCCSHFDWPGPLA